ncbi:cuticle protein 21-like [Maniola hyperantus]|uniref:cuticle protein 21-like n=1 Tax=Aphantopus hyperantus TaxID=2795564 RepID=UPI001569EB6A|nr:cuticle protein 21-like [Maniola hyperantus]
MAFVLKTFALLALTSPAFSVYAPGGYSYNRFSGPVSGKIYEVQVPAAEGAQQHADYGYNHQQRQIDPETAKYERLKTVDYKAKPDYHYAYGVQDPHSGNQQDHKETREGDVVRGEYSLVEPDGSIRLVRYTADDKNGFQATVHKQPGGKPNAPVRYTQANQQQEDSAEY